MERIKPYEYRLNCGLVFHTQTVSVPDKEGVHYFPCRRCKTWHKYTIEQLPTLQRSAASARDLAQAERLDKAIVKDRIVKDLRSEWDSDGYQIIADRRGVSLRTVSRVAAELGVSGYGGERATV